VSFFGFFEVNARGGPAQKKSRLAAAQSHNREASNRVDRSHSTSRRLDGHSYESKSLKDR
jgi:hypothetical protein